MDGAQPNKPAAPVKRNRGIVGFIKNLTNKSVISLALIVALAAAVFFGWQWHNSQNKLNHPDQAAKAQTTALVEQVNKLTVLPSGETPTVATVSDVSKLAGQTFFANAQNGDKVLIYSQAKKAYLYRPSTDKVINIAPLNINNKQ